jgi:hypothetical protein
MLGPDTECWSIMPSLQYVKEPVSTVLKFNVRY